MRIIKRDYVNEVTIEDIRKYVHNLLHMRDFNDALEMFFKMTGRLGDRVTVVQQNEGQQRKRMTPEEIEKGLEELNRILQ